jgi:sulfur carrier protein
MNIFLNGESEHLPDNATADDLVARLDLAGRRIAMEINGEILPRSQYAEHAFKPDDHVEIVHAIGGG